ncbi:MAG TPA: hypothetical protein VF950_15130 [Planctomycetota bacterium]
MSRFAVHWILITVPCLALLSPIHMMRGAGGIVNFVGCLEFVLLNNFVFSVLAVSAAAFGQEWLLAWHRRPARRWWAFMTAGAVVSWIANYGFTDQVLPWFMQAGSYETRLMVVSRSLCDGIAFGTAAALALWGRAWPAVARPWLAGVIGLYTLKAVLHVLLITLLGSPRNTDSPLAWSIALMAFDALVVSSGTALWLERLILKPAPETVA